MVPTRSTTARSTFSRSTPTLCRRAPCGPPMERMDTIARRLGIDPLEFRLKNLLKAGEELRAGARPIDADLSMGAKIAARGIGWGKVKKSPGQGLGIAVG